MRLEAELLDSGERRINGNNERWHRKPIVKALEENLFKYYQKVGEINMVNLLGQRSTASL